MVDRDDAEAPRPDGAIVARFDATAEPAADGPALAVAAVARRLGVAPATLRTWDRRYGLGPSEHSAGAHRRYSPADVERLLVMRRLTLDGVAPGDAARLALSPQGQTGARAGAPVVATPTMLVDAVLVDDRVTCARLLALDPQGDVAQWWTTLVEPALADLARRTVVDRPGLDAVRVLEGCALEALRDRLTELPSRSAPVVLLLVPTGVARPLVSHVVAAALAADGVDARLVGGPAGPRQTAELVVMTRPRAVVTVAPHHDPDLSLVGRLAEEHPHVPQFVMVAENVRAEVPVGPSVQRARTFPGLVHEVLAVAAP
ncbi:MerR family transcriptional regulator [Cellulomonas edaphi]|uniref:MerR family transcriptional regulator n=1 Tax=Cellulomonas edaphi TaxID=3053468 RepID=A0ABT7SAT5_9CELL|nr:MerR family transcriptional regulator [Cellulomons edaphi]MDM7832738.1 MerR family transcriptional regulator [Cellulomons edaphi]